MIEVVAAVSAASSAFAAIKKGFEVGRDIESMAGDMGRWMSAVSDIKKAEEYNKKPPLFKKLFASGSIEEEAMQVFMAKRRPKICVNSCVLLSHTPEAQVPGKSC